MYQRSDSSDSTRTNVPGRTGNTPDRGFNPQQTNTSSVQHDAKFDSIEIPVCVRSSRPRQERPTYTTQNIPAQQRSVQRPQAAYRARRTDMSRTGSAPYLYSSAEARRQAEMSRTRTSVTGTMPKTAKNKRKKRHPFIAFLLNNKKAAAVCAAMLLCICITVPLAVYGASFAENDSTSDFEMLGTSPLTENVIDAEAILLNGTVTSIAESSEPEESIESTTDAVTETDNAVSTEEAEDTTVAEDASESEEDEGSEGAAESEEAEATEEITEPEETESAEPETEPEDEPAPEIPTGFKVTVQFYDRDLLTCTTGPTTLRQILDASGIWLTENEKPSVGLDDPIEYESWITVSKTEYKQVTESEYIPYSSETVNSTSVPRGTYQTVVAGQNGVRDTVYTVEYLNGVEVNRTKEYDYIAVYPVNEVNHYGVGGTFTAPDGTVYSYSYCMNVRATYYNIHGTTASGMPTGNNVIATDPSVFPLGTRMYVMNDTFDMGVKIAADTGGAVRGNLIDIWMDASTPYYEQFARQGVWDMVVYVLD